MVRVLIAELLVAPVLEVAVFVAPLADEPERVEKDVSARVGYEPE